MCGVSKKRVLLAALIGLCDVVALHDTRAEPPHEPNGNHEGWSARPASGSLDLAPPAETQKGAATYAVRSRRLFESGPSAGESPSRFSSRAPAAEQSAPWRSPLQEIAHNFRREGLPVAKLFQDGTSLLHLGLNPRGTPGLWFVHQVR